MAAAAGVKKATSHKKFGDEVPVPKVTQKKKVVKEVVEESDYESDSDEAPEEESVSVGLQTEKARRLQEEQAFAAERHKEKEKRRKISERNAEQKKERLEREIEDVDEEIPDELPMDLLESYESEKVDAVAKEKPKPKKIKFEDSKATRLNEKLKLARKMNKQTVDKGPVRVALLKKQRVGAPVSVTKSKRGKWLNRKSVGRR